MRLLIAATEIGWTQSGWTESGLTESGLTGTEVAQTMQAGWHRSAPLDRCDLLPLSDGGRGFLAAADASLPPDLDETGPTAYLEAAQICGLHLLPPDRRDPGRATTAGVGAALAAARRAGARRIVVGADDTGTNDAGAGFLHAVGVGSDLLAGGGAGLADVRPADVDGLAEVVGQWRDIELVVATGSQSPLLGFGGASATGAVAKGATPEEAQALEAALGHFADVLQRRLPPRADLLRSAPIRLDRLPGAGAGGGLAFGLAVLGARIVPGGRYLLDQPAVRRRLAEADLVVVGVDELDPFALHGTALAALCELAAELAVPVVVLAGRAPAGRREAMSAGISGLYAMSEGFADPGRTREEHLLAIEDWTARIARTWGKV